MVTNLGPYVSIMNVMKTQTRDKILNVGIKESSIDDDEKIMEGLIVCVYGSYIHLYFLF